MPEGNITSVKPALIRFNHEGKHADIVVRDGQVVYEGDLPVGESARLLFEAFFQHADTKGFVFEKPKDV
jgi:hypothetical protein